jgi:hypothetical protein
VHVHAACPLLPDGIAQRVEIERQAPEALIQGLQHRSSG